MVLTEAEMVKFDNVFLSILQNCGKIEPFLDSIFFFLSRRTDFFHLMYSKNDKLGFPPGIAEKMLIKIFEKHQKNVLKDDPKYMAWKNGKQEKQDGNSTDKDNSVPEAIKEVTVQANEEDSSKCKDSSTSTKEDSSTSQSKEKESSACSASTNKDGESSSTLDVKKEHKESTKSIRGTILTPEDSFNGGVTDLYSWSQTISDVDVKIPVPNNIKKSKDLSIEIRHDAISVKLKSDPPADSELATRILMEGNLAEKIRCEESLWSLLPSQYISISLEKVESKWWTRVLATDQEIDKQKIDTTQQVTDFDDQTQSDIRKVMFDQHQKMLGQPTSDEQKTQDLLKKAWDAEGSPFKGTPFDPSRVNMGGQQNTPQQMGGFPGQIPPS